MIRTIEEQIVLPYLNGTRAYKLPGAALGINCFWLQEYIPVVFDVPQVAFSILNETTDDLNFLMDCLGVQETRTTRSIKTNKPLTQKLRTFILAEHVNVRGFVAYAEERTCVYVPCIRSFTQHRGDFVFKMPFDLDEERAIEALHDFKSFQEPVEAFELVDEL